MILVRVLKHTETIQASNVIFVYRTYLAEDELKKYMLSSLRFNIKYLKSNYIA